MKALCLQRMMGGCFVMFVVYGIAIGVTSTLRGLFSKKISLSFGVVTVGVIYTAITLKGVSYHQWKFAASIVLP